MSDVLVSVVLPVYNCKRYLRAAIGSVLRQRGVKFELVLIDDGSTDGSSYIIDAYAKLDNRIRVLRHGNRGFSASLNEGIEESRGRYLMRMDADDVSLPSRMNKQVQILEANAERVLVGSGVLLVDPDGDPLTERLTYEQSHKDMDDSLLSAGWPIVHPAVMMRRSTVLRIGGYRNGFAAGEDHDLFLRLAECGRLHHLPEALLLYRQHSESMSYAQRRIQGDSVLRSVRCAYRRRGLHDTAIPSTEVVPGQGEASMLRMWGWWAVGAGHFATARKHARAALLRSAQALESWRLLLFAHFAK